MANEYLAEDAVAVTPHDSTVQPKFMGLYIGTGGNLKVKTKAGNTTLFTALPTGTFLPLQNVELVYSTDTTAAAIVGLR
jgi:hypothetical protein